jgi:hypothetical protein
VRRTAGKTWGRWKRGMSLVDMGHSSIVMHRFRKTNPLARAGVCSNGTRTGFQLPTTQLIGAVASDAPSHVKSVTDAVLPWRGPPVLPGLLCSLSNLDINCFSALQVAMLILSPHISTDTPKTFNLPVLESSLGQLHDLSDFHV